VVNEFLDYSLLISKGVPSVLFVEGNDDLNIGPYNSPHAVLGVGYYWNLYAGQGYIVLDNINHGRSYISNYYVEYFGYIYEK